MDAEPAKKILIDVARLAPEGETVVGEADIAGIDEEFVRAEGPASYRLFVQAFGDEIVARGKVAQDFAFVCSRCGCDFRKRIEAELSASVRLPEREAFADLTSEARDAVLLEVPNFPVCGDSCPGVPAMPSAGEDPRWNALEGLDAAKTAKSN